MASKEYQISLFVIYRLSFVLLPSQEWLAQMETLPLPIKGYKMNLGIGSTRLDNEPAGIL